MAKLPSLRLLIAGPGVVNMWMTSKSTKGDRKTGAATSDFTKSLLPQFEICSGGFLIGPYS
jgi:hypothetical protein